MTNRSLPIPKTIPHHHPWEDALLHALTACGWPDRFRDVPPGISLENLFWDAFLSAAADCVQTRDDALASHLHAFQKAISTGDARDLCAVHAERALRRRDLPNLTVGRLLSPEHSSLGDLAHKLVQPAPGYPVVDFARTVHTLYLCALKDALKDAPLAFRQAS